MKKSSFIILTLTAFLLAGCRGDSDLEEYESANSTEKASRNENIRINEVSSAGSDWIELYNMSDADVPITGYILQDSKGSEEEFVLPDDTIKATGYITFDKEEDFEFGIGSSGDKIVLLDADGEEIDEVSLPAMTEGESYARDPDGTGAWSITDNPTKGKSN